MNKKIVLSLGLLMSLGLVGCDKAKDEKLATIVDSTPSSVKYKADARRDKVNDAMATLVEKRLDSGEIKSDVKIADVKTPSNKPKVVDTKDVLKLTEKKVSKPNIKKEDKNSSVLDIKETKLDLSSQTKEDKALISVINAGYEDKSSEEIKKIANLQPGGGVDPKLESSDYQKVFDKFHPDADDRSNKNFEKMAKENPYYKNIVREDVKYSPKVDKDFESVDWAGVPIEILDGNVRFEVFSLDTAGDTLVGHYKLINTKDTAIELKYGLTVNITGNINNHASFNKFAVMDDYNNYPTKLDPHQKYYGTFYINTADFLKISPLHLGFSSVNNGLKRLEVNLN